ncbi:MAG: U-box domain-containing protein, partial [Candidatus Berkiella sp.]
MDDPVHDGIAPQRIEYTVMLNCLERKNEHPFTRRKLRERDLIHDRALQKEIRDHLLGLDKPKPAPEQDQAEPAPLAPVITPARKSKQKARKTVSAKAAQDGAHSRPQRSSQRRR